LSKRARNRRIITITLSMTTFCLGFVIGMIVLYFTYENSKTKEESTPVVEIRQEEKPDMNVYIPKRERKLGMVAINSYNLDNFVMEDGYMAYYDDKGNKISHLGVDISYHQEEINWEELKASGCEFVIIRCGFRGYSEGGLKIDEKFEEYAKAANEYDIPMGVYFFTQAIDVSEAKEEAEFVLDLIKDYKVSYPVIFDTEYMSNKNARTRTNEISRELRTQMCKTFCETVLAAGYYPMIYASENWIRRDLVYEDLQEYDFWAPQYLDNNDFLYDFTIWQYTESGRMAGIKGEVDLDISMIDYTEFIPAMREAILNGGEIIKEENDEASDMESLDSKGIAGDTE